MQRDHLHRLVLCIEKFITILSAARIAIFFEALAPGKAPAVHSFCCLGNVPIFEHTQDQFPRKSSRLIRKCHFGR